MQDRWTGPLVEIRHACPCRSTDGRTDEARRATVRAERVFVVDYCFRLARPRCAVCSPLDDCPFNASAAAAADSISRPARRTSLQRWLTYISGYPNVFQREKTFGNGWTISDRHDGIECRGFCYGNTVNTAWTFPTNILVTCATIDQEQ